MLIKVIHWYLAVGKLTKGLAVNLSKYEFLAVVDVPKILHE